jgi:hypothetical protein
MSFEEASKDCITLEEWAEMWDKAIMEDPRFI